MEVTGLTDQSESRRFLEATKGNLEKAINLFLMQDSGNKRITEQNRVKSVSNDDVVVINHDIKNPPKENDKNDSEQRNHLKPYDDNIRPPIPSKKDVLVKQTFHESYKSEYEHAPNPVFEQFRGKESDMPFSPYPAGNLRYHNGYTRKNVIPVPTKPETSQQFKFKDEPSTSSSNQVKSKRDLASMFRPPIELIFQGDWDMALETAKSKKQWMLINIQNSKEWASQVLNRDIWPNAAVQEIIRNNFLLWQVYHDSPNGSRISGYYGIQSLPSIFIIDPRTGEETCQLKAVDAVSFLDQLTSFLGQYPDFEARDLAYTEEVTQHMKDANNIIPTPAHIPISVQPSSKHKRKFLEMDANALLENNDILEANLQAKRIKNVSLTDGDDLDAIMAIPSSSSNPGDSIFGQNRISAEEWFKYASYENSLIKAPEVKKFEVVLRLPPDGQAREILTLYPHTPIRLIFSFLAGLGIDPTHHSLVTCFPKRVFSLNDANRSIEQIGFSQREVIHVERN